MLCYTFFFLLILFCIFISTLVVANVHPDTFSFNHMLYILSLDTKSRYTYIIASIQKNYDRELVICVTSVLRAVLMFVPLVCSEVIDMT